MNRIEEIKQKVDLWFQFKLVVDINDIMPDVIYLLEELEQLQKDK